MSLQNFAFKMDKEVLKTMVFPVVMYGCESWIIKKLSAEELLCLNCSVGEYSWESFGFQGDQTSSSWRKSTLDIYWEDCCWRWSSNTLATWFEELTHRKRPCWETVRSERDGWMASPTQWTWVWAGSGRWWRTGKPGMLQSMGSQRVGYNWVPKQQQPQKKEAVV